MPGLRAVPRECVQKIGELLRHGYRASHVAEGDVGESRDQLEPDVLEVGDLVYDQGLGAQPGLLRIREIDDVRRHPRDALGEVGERQFALRRRPFKLDSDEGPLFHDRLYRRYLVVSEIDPPDGAGAQRDHPVLSLYEQNSGGCDGQIGIGARSPGDGGAHDIGIAWFAALTALNDLEDGPVDDLRVLPSACPQGDPLSGIQMQEVPETLGGRLLLDLVDPRDDLPDFDLPGIAHPEGSVGGYRQLPEADLRALFGKDRPGSEKSLSVLEKCHSLDIGGDRRRLLPGTAVDGSGGDQRQEGGERCGSNNGDQSHDSSFRQRTSGAENMSCDSIH